MNPNPAMNTEALDLEALRKGDEAAWADFFAIYRPVVQAVVSWPKWNFAQDVRDELVQDVCAELTRSIQQFEGRSSLRYYVKRVAANRCIDQVRRQVRDRQVFTPATYTSLDGESRELTFAAAESYDPVKRIMVLERVEALKRLLSGLDDTCAAAIRLFYGKGLAYKEIAGELKISINTVGSRLAKCLEKLRQAARQDPALGEEIAALDDKTG